MSGRNELEMIENNKNDETRFVEKEWNEAPLYMSVADIKKLGFTQSVIYTWFHMSNFPPVIKQNGFRVNKYKFKTWLESREVNQYI